MNTGPIQGLSVAIITYNEEGQITDCLESVRDIADEILVLDSFSKDGTEKIVREFPRTRFEAHPFDGHVQQKNRALEMCKGPWILSVDADERVTPELATSIRHFIAMGPSHPAARIKRLTWHLGQFIRHSGWYNSRYRLIQKGKATWAGENPHDEIRVEGWDKSRHKHGPLLKGDLLHYSFTDLSDQVDTINKFSSIVAFNRHARGKRPSVIKLIFKPLSKFLETYVFKLGFLDGFPGFVIAVSSAYSTFLKWAKLRELHRSQGDRPSNVRDDYKPQTD